MDPGRPGAPATEGVPSPEGRSVDPPNMPYVVLAGIGIRFSLWERIKVLLWGHVRIGVLVPCENNPGASGEPAVQVCVMPNAQGKALPIQEAVACPSQ